MRCQSYFFKIAQGKRLRNHLAGDGMHLNYAGTEVLWENLTFSLNNFL